MPKRRLEDLWVRGDFETFDDGQGEPVKVWVQKLSPIALDLAMRRANAARARVKTVEHQPDSDEYMEMWLEVLQWETREELVNYLVAQPENDIETRVEAQMALEDEWGEDGYLQGLRDAWEGGLKDAYIVDPEGPDGVEAARVLAELTRFADAVRERAAPEVADAREQFEDESEEELRAQCMKRVIRYRAATAWLSELRLSEVFYGTHPADNPRARYWSKREDFDALPKEVIGPLLAKYAELNVDVMEGKGSEGTPTSSPSSGPQPAPAPEASSGLSVVAP